MNKYYYIAPWVWTENEDGARWQAPAGTVGLFDLRGLVNTGEFGFFATSQPITELFALRIGDGTDLREYQTTKIERDGWRSLLGLKLSDLPDSTTLFKDVLIQTFETLGDPDGGERFLPPTVTSHGNLEFFLGGHSLISRRRFQGVDDPAWPRIQALLHRQYGNMVARGIEARKRLLSVWMKKYGLPDEKLFQPLGLNEKPESPHTTITDSFTRADQNIDGSTSSEGWSWAVKSGAGEIISNRLYASAGSSLVAVAQQALSSDDHFVQAYFGYASGTAYCPGILGRHNNTDDDYYQLQYKETLLNGVLSKIVSGSATQLNTGGGNLEWMSGIRLSANGSTLNCYKEETTLIIGPISDTAISGGLYTGAAIHGYTAASARIDDFVAEDLTAGGNAIMNQLQGPNLGADLFSGGIICNIGR